MPDESSSQAEPTPEPISHGALAKANKDHLAGNISDAEMEAIKSRYRCQLGIQSYC